VVHRLGIAKKSDAKASKALLVKCNIVIKSYHRFELSSRVLCKWLQSPLGCCHRVARRPKLPTLTYYPTPPPSLYHPLSHGIFIVEGIFRRGISLVHNETGMGSRADPVSFSTRVSRFELEKSLSGNTFDDEIRS
jgi:hypothetical protein